MRLTSFLLAALLLAGCGTGDLPDGQASGDTFVPATKVDWLTALVGPFTVNLNSGWNPVALQCATVTSLTAGPGLAGLAWYDGSTYQTSGVTATDFNAGEGTRRGFWLYAASPSTLTYSGTDSQGSTVTLRSGWNLVAFPASSNIPGASLTCRRGGQIVSLGSVVLPTFYETGSGSGYSVVDVSAGGSCRPGRAYWVYALDSATLTYGTTSPSPTPTASPSPGGASGTYTCFKTELVAVSDPASFTDSSGSYAITYQPGTVNISTTEAVGSGTTAAASFQHAWSTPPTVIRPGDVWPFAYNATVLSSSFTSTNYSRFGRDSSTLTVLQGSAAGTSNLKSLRVYSPTNMTASWQATEKCIDPRQDLFLYVQAKTSYDTTRTVFVTYQYWYHYNP